ncbi:MAG: hypothetical protein SGPRY_008620 [Prymnesium sp.]
MSRWRLVGSVRMGSSEFEWAADAVPAGAASRAGSRPEKRIEIEVDLGDHKPVWLGLAINESLQVHNPGVASALMEHSQ